MEVVLRRAAASGIPLGRMMFLLLWFWGCVTIENIHPLQGGYLRRKVRTDRRPGFKIESRIVFYPKYAAEMLAKQARTLHLFWKMSRVKKAIERDPNARGYTDTALTPVREDDLDVLEMFHVTEAARAASEKARRDAARHAVRA
jgi:hypothetical protein